MSPTLGTPETITRAQSPAPAGRKGQKGYVSPRRGFPGATTISRVGAGWSWTVTVDGRSESGLERTRRGAQLAVDNAKARMRNAA